MTTYEALAAATLPHGLMPLVVPQLKTITLGGAVAGLGIESTSFRHGLPHESVREMDVLHRRRRGRHRDAGRRARRPVRRVPQLLRHAGLRAAPGDRAAAGGAATSGCEHVRVDTADLAKVITERLRPRPGSARLRRRHRVRPGEHQYLTLGRFTDDPGRAGRRATTPGSRSSTAPSTSAPSTYLTVERLHLALGHRLVLVLARAGRAAPCGAPAVAAPVPPLGRLPPHRRPRPAHRALRPGPAAARAAAGGAGHAGRRDPGAAPRRVPRRRSTATSASPRSGSARSGCAASARGRSTRWPRASCTSTSASGRRCRERPGDPQAHNRRIERLVADLGGHKSLYSTVHYDEAEFWQHYNGPAYRAVKQRYDPRGRLPDLYAKVAG